MDTILLLGCWMSQLHLLSLNLMWILQKFMPTLHFISTVHLNWLTRISFSQIFWLISSDSNDLNSACFSYYMFFRRNQELIEELSSPAPGSQDLHFPTMYSQTFNVQFKACFWKWYRSYWRNPRYNAVRFFMTTIIGLMFGLIFWKKGSKTYWSNSSLIFHLFKF